MKVYLAGPMRGHPGWNFAAFDVARVRLTQLGHQVFCPAQLFRAMPYSMGDEYAVDRQHLQHVITSDLACLFVCDAIALIAGWQDSMGATVELAMAQFLGLKVLDEHGNPMPNVRRKPWNPRTPNQPA